MSVVTISAMNPKAKLGAGLKHVSRLADPVPGVILPKGQAVQAPTEPVE